MNKHATKIKGANSLLVKTDPGSPALKVTGRGTVIVKAGTRLGEHRFTADVDVRLPAAGLEPGSDYGVMLGHEFVPQAIKLITATPLDLQIGGFHFAPGGNAAARAGGDDTPTINPFSCWDLNFRPACPDPRGMALVELFGSKFWCDIYLTGANCAKDGTSQFGVAIADGDNRPLDASGKKYKRFDYETAVAALAAHGKGLLGAEEFFAAAFGVTERSSAKDDPETIGLDAPRTSKFGLMQATGNLWVWGHDGDPDTPRASFFGGSWWNGGNAGSRYADLGYWPGVSSGCIGARGRSDHLQPE